MADEADEKDGKEKENKEAAGLQKRLRKHEGDAMALAAELIAENADLRRQVDEGKKGKPKEGSLVLTPEQAKQWNDLLPLGKPEETIAAYNAYVALGKVEDIKTKLDEHKQLTDDNAELKKTELLRQIADAGITIDGKETKLKLSVFQTLDANKGGLTYEERDVTVDNKTQKAWHVKDGNKWVLLSEYVQSNWKDFIPALVAEGGSVGTGTKVPPQGPSDKAPPKADNVYTRIRKEQAEKQKKQKEDAIPLEKRLGQAA